MRTRKEEEAGDNDYQFWIKSYAWHILENFFQKLREREKSNPNRNDNFAKETDVFQIIDGFPKVR